MRTLHPILPMLVAALMSAVVWPTRAGAAGGATVMVFRSPELGAEEGRLIDALRIYTRDLDCRVVVAGKAPAVMDAAALDAVARQARREGAELATWVGRRDGARLFYFLLSVRDLDVRETEIAALGAERAAQELGLKVRTLLSLSWRPAPEETTSGAARATGGTSRAEAASAGPPPSTARASSPSSPSSQSASSQQQPSPSPAVPAQAADARPPTKVSNEPQPPPPPIAAADEVSASAPPPLIAAPGAEPRPATLVLRAGYLVVSPLDSGWLRQGMIVSAEVRLGSGPFSLFADEAFTTRPQTAAGGFDTTLGDLPFGAGVQRRWRLSRVAFAAGPRVGLHVFDARTTSADGRSGSSRQLSAGLGALARVEVRLWSPLTAYAGISAEALVPAQKFTVDGAPIADSGRFLFGGAVGLAFSVF